MFSFHSSDLTALCTWSATQATSSPIAWIRLAPPEHIVKSGHADGYICFLAGQLHQAALTMVAFDRRKTFAALIEAWAGFNDATIEWWQKGSVPFEAREEGPFNAA